LYSYTLGVARELVEAPAVPGAYAAKIGVMIGGRKMVHSIMASPRIRMEVGVINLGNHGHPY
jgi:hypothetical protein